MIIPSTKNNTVPDPGKEKGDLDANKGSSHRKKEKRGSHAKKKTEVEAADKNGHNHKHSKHSKKKGHHDKHHHHHHAKESEEETDDSKQSSISSNEMDEGVLPDYHWEAHVSKDSSPKSSHHHHKERKSVTHSGATFEVLNDEEETGDGIFDIALDEEEEGPVKKNNVRKTTKEPGKAAEASDEIQFDSEHLEEEEQLDDEALDMAEDEALQTTPSPPPHPKEVVDNAMSVSSSPRPRQELLAPRLSPPAQTATPESLSPKSHRLSLHDLGNPVPRHNTPSFIPPFLVETDDDNEEEDEEEEDSVEFAARKDKKDRSDHHFLNAGSNSVSSNSSGELEWPDVVPEAMGMDEAIPQINQERCSSLL